MPTLFILDMPELAPLIRAARSAGCAIESRAGYAIASSSVEIVLQRKVSGLADALWFSAVAGGYEGRIAEFNGERLRLVD